MAKVELIMPKMGESITEATILKWVKNVGDSVEADEAVLEIATDKVDSEVPSPFDGKLVAIHFKEDDVVPVGTVLAIIETEEENSEGAEEAGPTQVQTQAPVEKEKPVPAVAKATAQVIEKVISNSDRFYSPLVKNIASQEGINQTELDQIHGTGSKNRVTKKDILAYIEAKKEGTITQTAIATPATTSMAAVNAPKNPSARGAGADEEIIQMGRMRKLIADHMVKSKQTSPHVTSFVEADVTNLVNWRNKIKGDFQKKYGEKITYTPIFIEAVVNAIKDFPMINVSIDGDNIILKKRINVGMAAALPSGNLIVPVIKDADHLNLIGLTKAVNDLANRARTNKLKPEDIQGGTFTLTNVGTFGNVFGTPIINQPQVAIMAAGAIKKKPAVLETEHGDVIAIRHMMFLSHSYDHRVVDGFLGGSFLRKVADYLEAFDPNRAI